MPLLRPSDLEYRRGTEPFSLASLNRTVTFATPMPTADYDIYFRFSGVSVSVQLTNKTQTGFTIVVGLSLGTMTLDWIAIEKR